MKVVLFLTVIFVIGCLCQKYTTKFDNVDLDNILKNERLLRNYMNCLLDKGKCSSDAVELKKVIPEALENECEKCSEKHRDGVKKVIKYLVENKRDYWNELLAKYDPEGNYRKKYEELSKKEEVQI
uniref:Chemosensory protein n=1 Tax=Anoplophora chinensis TaxID=217632 RepID=A0A2H4ZB67_ANOCN|nr:chemosensory protein [Anoplophora chinensis]